MAGHRLIITLKNDMEQLRVIAEERGFPSVSAFINDCVRKQLDTRKERRDAAALRKIEKLLRMAKKLK